MRFAILLGILLNLLSVCVSATDYLATDYLRDYPIISAAGSVYDKENRIRSLYEEGYDINEARYDSLTALHLAVMAGHVSNVKILIDLGADINKTNNRGYNALDFALGGRDASGSDKVTLLKAAGAIESRKWGRSSSASIENIIKRNFLYIIPTLFISIMAVCICFSIPGSSVLYAYTLVSIILTMPRYVSAIKYDYFIDSIFSIVFLLTVIPLALFISHVVAIIKGNTFMEKLTARSSYGIILLLLSLIVAVIFTGFS